MNVKLAATAALSAVALATGAALAAADNSSAPDCQQRVLRLADRLSATTHAADASLAAWNTVAAAGTTPESEQVVQRWRAQYADQQATRRDYETARATCGK